MKNSRSFMDRYHVRDLWHVYLPLFAMWAFIATILIFTLYTYVSGVETQAKQSVENLGIKNVKIERSYNMCWWSGNGYVKYSFEGESNDRMITGKVCCNGITACSVIPEKRF